MPIRHSVFSIIITLCRQFGILCFSIIITLCHQSGVLCFLLYNYLMSPIRHSMFSYYNYFIFPIFTITSPSLIITLKIMVLVALDSSVFVAVSTNSLFVYILPSPYFLSLGASEVVGPQPHHC